MISYQTYKEIRHLFDNKGMTCKMIASQLQLNICTVKKWVARDHYEGRKAGKRSSLLDPYKSAIRLEWELGGCPSTFILKGLKEAGYTGGRRILSNYLHKLGLKDTDLDSKPLLPFTWMLRLIQGEVSADVLATELAEKTPREDIFSILKQVCDGALRDRKRAVAVLAHLRNIPTRYIAQFLNIDWRTVERFVQSYRTRSVAGLFDHRISGPKKHEQEEYKSAVFALLHSPPLLHGINRTSWRMDDLVQMMRHQGKAICKETIRQIIRSAGYRFRKAKRVLTSPDPEYREKVELVLNTLQNLKPDEHFFFIDELGPLRVKKYGGRAIVHKDDALTYPQVQPDRGSIIMAGALSATTNQVTWLYGPRKDSQSMIDLIEILFNQHPNATRIYLTWDAASWHGSSQLVEWLDAFNADTANTDSGSIIHLVPLPTSSQFLDVIESIFSAMKGAVIHHSDYKSENEMKTAISRHFMERNAYFAESPKRVGKKIWEVDFFQDTNNLRSGNYREW